MNFPRQVEKYIQELEKQNEFLLEERQRHLYALEEFEPTLAAFLPLMKNLCESEKCRIGWMRKHKKSNLPRNFSDRVRQHKQMKNLVETFELILEQGS